LHGRKLSLDPAPSRRRNGDRSKSPEPFVKSLRALANGTSSSAKGAQLRITAIAERNDCWTDVPNR
jgi:hypothetical protein